MDINYIETDDVLIIGSGLAGMMAALEVKNVGHEPVIFTKGKAGRDGSTVQAEADISLDSASCRSIFGLPGDKEDSPEKFLADMVRAGMYLNDQELVEKHVHKAPEYFKILKELGLRVDGLLQTPGHSHPRGVSTTGSEVVRVFQKELKKKSLKIKEHQMLLEIITVENKAQGILVLDLKEGELNFYGGRAVIIAAGGAAGLYLQTTNSLGMTGDGMAAAYRAGADLQDMEFPMFLPFTMITPEILKGMSFPYDLCVNLNAHLLNKRGERYLKKWDPRRMEDTTRDINSIAAEMEIKTGNGGPNQGVYMSFKHLPDNLLEYSSTWLPASVDTWTYGNFNYRELSVDIRREAFEVKPGCHFWNGGVTIDKASSTNVAGLFACGEVTGGIHGSNRISGNALTEALVWGGEAGRSAAAYCNAGSRPLKEKVKEQLDEVIDKFQAPFNNEEGHSPLTVRKKVQSLAEDYLRPVSSAREYDLAWTEYREIEEMIESQATVNKRKIYNKEWQIALENYNLLLITEMLIGAGNKREESRGAHYRTDFPKTDNKDWLYNIIIKKDRDNKLILEKKRPILKEIKPASRVFAYGKGGTLDEG